MEENAWPGPGRSVPFYVAHGVDEVLVVEPDERRASVYVLEG